MKKFPFVKLVFSLVLLFILGFGGGVAWAQSAAEMKAKVDDELIAGNITDEATYTDLKAVLTNAETATTQEDKDSAKDAYNTLVMVNDGVTIKTEAVTRLIWP